MAGAFGIKGFARVAQAFDEKRDAEEWAAQTVKGLREKRARRGARPRVATLPTAQLTVAFPGPRTSAAFESISLALACRRRVPSLRSTHHSEARTDPHRQRRL